MSEQIISPPAHSHVLLLNRGGSGSRLFMVPGIGGRCEGFRNLAGYFGDVCAVYGLNMMGTNKDETPLADIELIASRHIVWIKEIQARGPYMLLGHSFGAFVAFEMARQLGRHGESVSPLIILDQEASQDPVLEPNEDPVSYVLKLTMDYARDFKIINVWERSWSQALRPALTAMPFTEYTLYIGSFLLQELKKKRRMIDLVMRLVNLRMYNALMAYYPREKLSGRLMLFRASEEDGDRKNDDPAMGWAGHAATIDTICVPGNHISLVFGENARHIASAVIPLIRTVDSLPG